MLLFSSCLCGHPAASLKTRIQVLVTDITDPDWEPVMKVASAIVTNRGGRTCHAAIISRELGIPAVIGTDKGTELIADGQEVTVCCAEGEVGQVLEGLLPYEKAVERETGEDKAAQERRRTKLMLILANPDTALGLASLDADGIGLARLEFIISRIGAVFGWPVARLAGMEN